MDFNFLSYVIGIPVAIIGYFLKQTMEDLKRVKQMSFENKSQIDIMKNDYQNKIDHMAEKFDELKQTMNDLIKEIKELNKVWHKRN